MMFNTPQINVVYAIRLCSGELRLWKHLGIGEGQRIWWSDISTGSVFNEDTLLYAWVIEAVADQDFIDSMINQ